MRTVLYVDGFNLYYGACRRPGRRWLHLGALAELLLADDDVLGIEYFTANVKKDPDDPGKQDRQLAYLQALRTVPNLRIHLGRYLPKTAKGELLEAEPGENTKDRLVLTWEEKGTDVNLATRLLVDGFADRYESAAVLSNDGDLKMPIQVVREALDRRVTVINPCLNKRRSAALSPDPLPKNAKFHRLTAREVERCQFPDTLRTRKGAKLTKPVDW